MAPPIFAEKVTVFQEIPQDPEFEMGGWFVQHSARLSTIFWVILNYGQLGGTGCTPEGVAGLNHMGAWQDNSFTKFQIFRVFPEWKSHGVYVPDQSCSTGRRALVSGLVNPYFGLTSQLLQCLHTQIFPFADKNLPYICVWKTFWSIERYSTQIGPGCICFFLNKIRASRIKNHRSNSLPKFLKSSHLWSIQLLSFCNCCGLSSNQLRGKWVPSLRPELVLKCSSLRPNCSKEHLVIGLLAILLD